MAEITLETPEELREAIGVLAKEIVRLEEVVKAQGELMRGMDQKNQLLIRMNDNHERRIEVLEATKPKGNFNA